MKSLNKSFDIAYAPSRNQNKSHEVSFNSNFSGNNESFRNNSSMLNNTRRGSTPNKKLKFPSFHPQTTLAEYNMVNLRNKASAREKSPTKMDDPQRIMLPYSFNTPYRVEIAKHHASQSPKKSSQESDKDLAAERPFTANFNISAIASINQNVTKLNIPTDVKVSATRRLKDYAILVTACRRAGKNREEGRAYYSMGVLCDNLGKFKKAIEWYKQFLSVCKSISDTHGEGLAYNCLGVDCQILGDITGDRKNYELSLKYHQRHKDISDTSGKFTASVNLGIVFTKLGDGKTASLHFQHALRYALQLQDAIQQSIAIQHLGKIGSLDMGDNITKMQSFVEKYLQLSKDLNNKVGEGSAYLKMGQILTDQKNYEEGIINYKKAFDVALQTDNTQIKGIAKFSYGVAQGLLSMEDHLENIKKKIQNE